MGQIELQSSWVNELLRSIEKTILSRLGNQDEDVNEAISAASTMLSGLGLEMATASELSHQFISGYVSGLNEEAGELPIEIVKAHIRALAPKSKFSWGRLPREAALSLCFVDGYKVGREVAYGLSAGISQQDLNGDEAVVLNITSRKSGSGSLKRIKAKTGS